MTAGVRDLDPALGLLNRVHLEPHATLIVDDLITTLKARSTNLPRHR
jgi:hypothetical protein